MLIQSKQINKMMLASVGVSAFTTGTSTSDNITTILGTTLSTASASGGSVPSQVGSLTTEGVSTASGLNYCTIYNSGVVKTKLTDSAGNDVYGKVTFATSTFTLSYFSAPSGVETAYTMPSALSIDFEVPYWFTFADLPSSAFIGPNERHVVSDQPTTTVTRIASDSLTPSATNTLPALSHTYATGGMFLLNVNGQMIPAASANGVTVSGTAITINATNLGFNILTTDSVTAIYVY